MTYSAMERFRDALGGRPKDRVPLFPMIAGWAAKTFSGVPLSELAKDPKGIVDAQVRAREAVGHDALFAYADALFVPEAFGCQIRYPAAGPLAEPLPFKPVTLEDIDRIPVPDPRNGGRLPIIHEVVRGLSAYGRGDIPVLGALEGPFTTTCRIIEPDLVMRMIFKSRQVLEALLDRMTGFLLEFGRALKENGANVIFLPEPTASATMISPKVFRELVLPRLQRLTGGLAMPCILHICGDTSLILDLMDKSGADVLSLDQCMNLAGARAVVPDQVLGGNVDPINALLMGSEEKVAENTLDCLRAAGTGKYILMTGCGVPPGTSIENVRTMIQTAIAYGLGPKL